MGSWGIGPFENDAASDWLVELGEAGIKAIDDALDSLIEESESEFIDVDVGSNAVAASEILARVSNGKLKNDEPLETSGVDMSRLKNAATPTRKAKALKAAQLVLAEHSELRELWEDADQLSEWRKSVNDIVKRLKA